MTFSRDQLRLDLRDGAPDRDAEFDTGGENALLLVQREGSSAPIAMVAMAGAARALTFTVDDEGYDSWKKWLVKCGVPIKREARLIHGGRSLLVRDPDERRIEFKTPAVKSAPTRPPMAVEQRRE